MPKKIFGILFFSFFMVLGIKPVSAQTFGPICEATTTPGATVTCSPSPTSLIPTNTSTPTLPLTPQPTATTSATPTLKPTATPTSKPVPKAGNTEITLFLLAVSGVFTLGSIASFAFASLKE